MITDYTADSIEVLEDLAHIRLRPGMYIADVGKNGLHQLIKEAVDNAIDEALAGYAKNVWIYVENGIVTVRDDGRGIPVEIHSKTKVSTLTSVFTKLHAGGKFGKQAYVASSGLHGVGIKATNALSEWLDVVTVRPYEDSVAAWHQRFERGEPVTDVERTKRDISTDQTGTTVSFKPDKEIFGNIEIDLNLLTSWAENLSYLCAGVKFHLNDILYYQEEGLVALAKKRIGNEPDDLITEVISAVKGNIEIALAWTKAIKGENWEAFVNTSPTPDGGTHVTGAKKAITRTLKDRTKEVVLGDDLREGLYLIIHYRTSDPLFQGQTKVKLLNSEAEGEVHEVLSDTLAEYWEANPGVANALINRAVELYSARATFEKKKAAIKKVRVTKKQKGILPGKLAEAPFCEPTDRELYVCEGQSAGGSLKQARDSSFQEVLPLRGKVINAARGEFHWIMKNEELTDVVRAIGCGIADECQVSKSRVGKVLLLMDADPDGQHISALLLSFFVLHMKPIVEAGLIYVVDSPLFVGSWKNKRVYGHTREEVENQLGGKGFVTRLKGHGEAEMAEIREYAMNPETRKLWKVTFGENDNELILSLMGDDTTQRRTILGI